MTLLEHAVEMFNDYMAKTWDMLTTGLTDFMDGQVWAVMAAINSGLTAGGLALLVVFTFMGILKSTVSLTELKRPEAAVRVIVRFIFAKALITYGSAFMLYIFEIIQSAVHHVAALRRDKPLCKKIHCKIADPAQKQLQMGKARLIYPGKPEFTVVNNRLFHFRGPRCFWDRVFSLRFYMGQRCAPEGRGPCPLYRP